MKPDLTHIHNIIFDLGNVLLNLNLNATVEAFKKLGLDYNVVDQQQAYSDPVFYELEIGRISPARFRNRVREIIQNPNATDSQIDEAWYAMLLDLPEERVHLLKKLRKKFRLYLFSNTNEIHINHMHKKFRETYGFEFSTLFENDFYSHKINERKPDLESFQKVIEISGINPEKTLFIDDLEKNIIGAQQAGWKTYWLKNGQNIVELF